MAPVQQLPDYVIPRLCPPTHQRTPRLLSRNANLSRTRRVSTPAVLSLLSSTPTSQRPTLRRSELTAARIHIALSSDMRCATDFRQLTCDMRQGSSGQAGWKSGSCQVPSKAGALGAVDAEVGEPAHAGEGLDPACRPPRRRRAARGPKWSRTGLSAGCVGEFEHGPDRGLVLVGADLAAGAGVVDGDRPEQLRGHRLGHGRGCRTGRRRDRRRCCRGCTASTATRRRECGRTWRAIRSGPGRTTSAGRTRRA